MHRKKPIYETSSHQHMILKMYSFLLRNANHSISNTAKKWKVRYLRWALYTNVFHKIKKKSWVNRMGEGGGDIPTSVTSIFLFQLWRHRFVVASAADQTPEGKSSVLSGPSVGMELCSTMFLRILMIAVVLQHVIAEEAPLPPGG